MPKATTTNIPCDVTATTCSYYMNEKGPFLAFSQLKSQLAFLDAVACDVLGKLSFCHYGLVFLQIT